MRNNGCMPGLDKCVSNKIMNLGTNFFMDFDTSFWPSLFRTILLCRDATQLVVEKSDQLVKYLLQEGSSVPQNMDKLLLRESMDVIGKLCFYSITHNSWIASYSSIKRQQVMQLPFFTSIWEKIYLGSKYLGAYSCFCYPWEELAP